MSSKRLYYITIGVALCILLFMIASVRIYDCIKQNENLEKNKVLTSSIVSSESASYAESVKSKTKSEKPKKNKIVSSKTKYTKSVSVKPEKPNTNKN